MTAKDAHMWLMAVGWGIIIPLGIVSARAKNLMTKRWFTVHRIIQSIGFCLGIAGIGCGFAIRGTWSTPFTVHRDLGITITVLGAVQIISLVAKPELGTKARTYWTPWHTWLGRATALLAIANVYYGMIHVADVNSWAWVVYTVILAIIIAVGIANDIAKVYSRIPLQNPKGG